MTGYVYMLLCANGKLYTGSTVDLLIRLGQHQQGVGANFTSKYLPVTLVYVEEFPRIDLAFEREKQIQGWSRKKKDALIAGKTNDLRLLAECQNASHCNNVKTHGFPDPSYTTNFGEKLSIAEPKAQQPNE